MMIRTLRPAILALGIGSASAEVAAATEFGDSFTEPGTSWSYVLDLARSNFARLGVVCNPNLTTHGQQVIAGAIVARMYVRTRGLAGC
jgi:hypothetical protein